MPGMAGAGPADFPIHRPRRLRRTQAIRDLVAETNVSVTDLIAPLFVREGIDSPIEIASLPGVYQVKSGSDQAAMDGSKYSDW